MGLLVAGNNPAALKSSKKIYFTATAGQTTFTVTDGYSVGDVEVYMNGLRLVEGDDFSATNGSTVVLTSGANLGDSVLVVSYNQFLTSNSYTKAESDNRYLQVTGGTLSSYLRTPNYGVSSYSDSAFTSLEANPGLGEQGVGIKAFGRSMATYGGDILYTSDNRGAGGRHRFGYWNGTSFTNTMLIDSSGRITKPNQVAFHVSNTSQPTSTTFSSGESTLLRFENVNFNIGNGWNSSTYRFTAPVAGRYFVYGQTRFDGLTGYSRLYVSVNGNTGWWSPGIHNITPNASFAYWSSSVSGVVYLSVGEYIELRGGANNSTGSHQGEGSFGAYLLG